MNKISIKNFSDVEIEILNKLNKNLPKSEFP